MLQLEESKNRVRWACQAKQPFWHGDKSCMTSESLWRIPKLMFFVQGPEEGSQSALGEDVMDALSS